MKEKIINCVFIIISIVIAITVSELFCLVFNIPPKFKRQHKLFCKYDPVLGWSHKPNTTASYRNPEYKVKEFFNSKGLRGPEYSYEKSTGEFRILILGDSFAEGYTVDFENIFSEILKKGLNNRKVNCTVINAGTGGYSTDQEFLFFKTEGKKYKPDLTVLMFYENDVWYNNQIKYWRGYKPLFKVVGKSLVLTNSPVPKPDSDEPRISLNLGSIVGWVGYHSRICNLIGNFIKNNRWLLKTSMQLHLAKEQAYVPKEIGISKKDCDPAFRDAWNVTEAIIEELTRETSSVDSKFLVFHVPSKLMIYEGDRHVFKEQYGVCGQEWDPTQFGRRLRNICKKHNIDFVDPTQIFKAEADKLNVSGKRLYFIKDEHWNILGHNFAGNFLDNFIYENYLKIE